MNQVETRSSDASFMEFALAEARQASDKGEVPVGAIIVCGNQIVGKGYNRREELQSPVAHAEILAIEEAARTLGSWRLTECHLFVTLEPCVMCVGAILQARLHRVVFGCLDPKAGAVESLYRLCGDRRLNHQVSTVAGVLADNSATLLGDFFSRLRERNRILRNAERWPSPVEGA
ncbi:MAG: tRNA-specific adenosine deaminase [Deltaproteobacteria bacterium]|nr:tRNA-specific adenosine deaminase [Deltaproteobacteria bacterium]